MSESLSLRGLEQVLTAVETAARERRPLPTALRELNGADANQLAEALERGESLAEAFGNRIPETVRALLSGPRPDLASAALLAGRWIRDTRERRRRLWEGVLFPVISLLLILVVVVLASRHFPIAWHWWWLAVPGVLLALLPLIALIPQGAKHLPWLCGWRTHAERAERWDRVALGARWRLDEASLRELVGSDLSEFTPILSLRDADEHCQRMATVLRRRSTWHLRILVLITALGLHLLAAGALLGSAAGAYTHMMGDLETMAFGNIDD